MDLPWVLRVALVLSWPIGAAVAFTLAAPPELGIESVGTVPNPGPASSKILTWHADSLVARDPFRVSRRPASAVFGEQRVELPAEAPGMSPTVSGIIWSSPPAAIVSGIPVPGESRVMRVGDVVSGIRLTRIRPSEIILNSAGDTWRLRLPDPATKAP
jgi:hypothetical protein